MKRKETCSKQSIKSYLLNFKGVLWIDKLQLQYIIPLIPILGSYFRKQSSPCSDRKCPQKGQATKKGQCIKSDIQYMYETLECYKNNAGQEVLKVVKVLHLSQLRARGWTVSEWPQMKVQTSKWWRDTANKVNSTLQLFLKGFQSQMMHI